MSEEILNRKLHFLVQCVISNPSWLFCRRILSFKTILWSILFSSVFIGKPSPLTGWPIVHYNSLATLALCIMSCFQAQRVKQFCPWFISLTVLFPQSFFMEFFSWLTKFTCGLWLALAFHRSGMAFLFKKWVNQPSDTLTSSSAGQCSCAIVSPLCWTNTF